jgi:hypothetical protein
MTVVTNLKLLVAVAALGAVTGAFFAWGYGCV